MKIDYVDAFGNETTRTVNPIRLGFHRDRQGRILPNRFIAHCHVADDLRCFIIDRIDQAIDLDNREKIYSVDQFLIERIKG